MNRGRLHREGAPLVVEGGDALARPEPFRGRLASDGPLQQPAFECAGERRRCERVTLGKVPCDGCPRS